jgi:hypothetical protein
VNTDTAAEDNPFRDLSTRRMSSMFEYEVFTVRDTWVSGSFDAASLEDALNGYAADGWRLTESFLATSLGRASRRRSF